MFLSTSVRPAPQTNTQSICCNIHFYRWTAKWSRIHSPRSCHTSYPLLVPHSVIFALRFLQTCPRKFALTLSPNFRLREYQVHDLHLTSLTPCLAHTQYTPMARIVARTPWMMIMLWTKLNLTPSISLYVIQWFLIYRAMSFYF